MGGVVCPPTKCIAECGNCLTHNRLRGKPGRHFLDQGLDSGTGSTTVSQAKNSEAMHLQGVF